MITVVFVKNPFSGDREVRRLEYEDGKTLGEYAAEIKEYAGDQELRYQLNGDFILDKDAETTAVPDDSYIVVAVPVQGHSGRKIFGAIAMVALAVVSFGVGGLASGAGWTAIGATSAWTTAGYVAAAAVMFLGGQLISRFIGRVDSGKYNSADQTNNPTYGWSGITTMEDQGNPIAITYGRVKSGGQSIGKYLTNNGTNQYLNWLVAAGEGPLTISEIKLNDNLISNYNNVQLEVREGINDQEIISNFNDTYSNKAMSYELNDSGYRLDVTDGNSAEGLEVTLECSSGLYYANDEGSLSGAWVRPKIEYRKKNTETWRVLAGPPRSTQDNTIKASVVGTSTPGVGTYTVTTGYESWDDGYYKTDDDGDYIYDYEGEKIWVSVPRREECLRLNGSYKTIITGRTGMITVNGITMDVDLCRELQPVSFTVIDTDGILSGSTASAIRKSFRKDNLPIGQYEVRVSMMGRSHSVYSSRACVKCFWTVLTSIMYDDFVYPNTALIGIKALATSQINGTPNMTFIKEREKVWVWNPNSEKYEEEPANNPAWAAYDFCHGARKLKNVNTNEMEFDFRGAPKELMMYDRFKAWADRCESKKLKINYETVVVGEFWDIVNAQIASIGRGKVVMFGTKFGCIWDAPSDPVQLFTMGNIVSGSFTEEFLSTKDRADYIECTINDAAQDYQKHTFAVYGDDYDTMTDVPNSTQISMDGCTDYEQAFRECKYQLYTNKLRTRTVSFTADIDAIGCTVGDQILVAHDVTRWGIASGRILKVVGDNQIVIPMEVELAEGKTYQIQLRTLKDTLYTYEIDETDADGGKTTITIVGTFTVTDMPATNDIFDLGELNKSAKPFVVVNITRSQEFTRTITALEYNEAVFEENYEIPPIQYSAFEDPTAKNVTRLTGQTINYRDKAGVLRAKMYLSWQAVNNSYTGFDVLLSEDGVNWPVAGNFVTEQSAELDVVPDVAYYVKVITRSKLTRSSGTQIFVDKGQDYKPPNVKMLDHELLADGTRRYWWTFDYPKPDDIAGFRLKYIQGNVANWDAAVDMHTGLITMQPFETCTVRSGVHTVMIKAVDNGGQESEDAATCYLNLGDLLEDNVLFTKEFDLENDFTGTGEYENERLQAVGISPAWQEGQFAWYAPSEPYWTPKYDEFEETAVFRALASGQFWVDCEVEGPLTIEYRTFGNKPFWGLNEHMAFWTDGEAWPTPTIWKTYSGKVMVEAGEFIQLRLYSPGNSTQQVVVKRVRAFIDVPDREEHFNNVVVPTAGCALPIKTPHHYTTAVRIDAVQSVGVSPVPVLVSRSPCVIKITDMDGVPIEATIDCTWQGFEKEVIL